MRVLRCHFFVRVSCRFMFHIIPGLVVASPCHALLSWLLSCTFRNTKSCFNSRVTLPQTSAWAFS